MHRYNPVLYLLFAGFIAFLQPDLLRHLSNSEITNRLPEAPILAVGLPPALAVIAASRAQQMWASAPTKQNAQHVVIGSLCVPTGIQSSSYGSQVEFDHPLQPHKARRNCDRAPPRSSSP
jgi:hypothetical protein